MWIHNNGLFCSAQLTLCDLPSLTSAEVGRWDAASHDSSSSFTSAPLINDGKQEEKSRCDRASSPVLESLTHHSDLPHRLSYRTGQDTANCDTCRNSACIIYRLVVIALPRRRDTKVSRPLCPEETVQRWGGGGDSRETGKGQEDSTLIRVLLMSTHTPFHTMFSL